MTPESSFEMDEMEFEKELKGLGKKEFIEFRKKFREFSSEVAQRTGFLNMDQESTADKDGGEERRPLTFKDHLRIISTKLHLLKKEHEKREVQERIHERIKEMLKTPEEMLQIDDTDFREAIHNMDYRMFMEYVQNYKELFKTILHNRKKIIHLNSTQTAFDKEQRDNLKVIKRWDLIEEEINDREKRIATAS